MQWQCNHGIHQNGWLLESVQRKRRRLPVVLEKVFGSVPITETVDGNRPHGIVAIVFGW